MDAIGVDTIQAFGHAEFKKENCKKKDGIK